MVEVIQFSLSCSVVSWIVDLLLCMNGPYHNGLSLFCLVLLFNRFTTREEEH